MAAGSLLLRRAATTFLALVFSAASVLVAANGEEAACAWPMYGHDPGRSFAQPSECSRITKTNASTLRLKWFAPTGDTVTASPSVVDGVVYVGSWDESFYALDAETGEVLWTFPVEDDHNIGFGRIVSSAAVDTVRVAGDDVRVVLFGGGGTLYALDPADGSLLAEQDVDPRSPALKALHAQQGRDPEIEILSSPVVGHFQGHDDRIFVGMDVHNDAGVGRAGLLSFKLAKNEGGPRPYRFALLYKFDPETDRVLHSLTNPNDPSDPDVDTGWGCGGVWSSPALHPDALQGEGVIVFGTSNCDNVEESVDAGEVGREGIFAIKAKAGDLLWKFHPRGPNHLDDDFGASPNLLPGGLVGEGGKDGRYYGFNLLTGATPPPWPPDGSHVGQAGHVTNDFAIGGIIGTPAVGEATPVGAAQPEPAIFVTTALSTPIGEPLDGDGPDPLSRVDASLADDPGRMLSLHAISAIDGHVIWRAPLSRQAYGAPTYANHLVFVPSTFDFSLKVFDADTGLPLTSHPLPGAPSSAPAVVEDSVYMGAGTRDGSMPFLAPLNGIVAFELAESAFSPSGGWLLNAQGNQLDKYDLSSAAPGTTRETVINSHTHSATPPDDDGNDVNGQICRVTQDDGSVRYVMGEDSDQGIRPLGEAQGWGIFDPTRQNSAGTGWKMTGKLVPTYNFDDPENDHLPDNTGCAVSADGSMLFTIDLGIGAFDADAVGSLFVFYRDGQGDFSSASPFCVLDDHLTTAGYIALDDDGSVLVPESGRSAGGVISRFAPPFPSASGPCVYNLATQKSDFIRGAENPLVFTPISIVRRESSLTGGKWLVGNVFPGVVAEFDADGDFVRPVVVLQGPGVAGMAVDAAGTLYIANLGLVPCESILCPMDGAGTLWKVSFAPGADAPLPPVPVMAGLDFPEGMGIFPSLVP